MEQILKSDTPLISLYTFEDLASLEEVEILRNLQDYEIENIKYINHLAKIIIKPYNYDNCFKIIKKIQELKMTNKIVLNIIDKEEFYQYLVKHINEIELDNIEVLNYEKNTIVSLKDFLKYEKRLYDMVKYLDNLSPFEKYLCIYNITKLFKRYKENEQDYSSARELYKILDSDFMVCAGYSNLLEDLAHKLGFECFEYLNWVDTNLYKLNPHLQVLPDFYLDKDGNKQEVLTSSGGHSRVLIHLVDPKYDIDGYYVADPTWDNDDKKDYYNFAALTNEEYSNMTKYNYIDQYNSIELFFVSTLEEYYAKLNFLIKKNRLNKLDIIKEVLNYFAVLDKTFYNKIITKYGDILKISLYKEELLSTYDEILLEIGLNNVSKSNKQIKGYVYKKSLEVIYHEVYEYDIGETKKTVKTILEDNMQRQSKVFPKRYKIDKDGNVVDMINIINKFSLDVPPIIKL